MFSFILEFFEKAAKRKWKKQQKLTKKEVKQIENDPHSDIVESKKRIAKSPKVRDSKDKEKKFKLKYYTIAIIKWIVGIIEQFIFWLISLLGVFGFFIVLVVIVLMIAIYGLLHIDTSILDSIFMKVSAAECIQQSATITQTGFDMGQFEQLSGTYTDYQKNLMRTFKVYNQCFDGTFGKRYWEDKYPDIINSVGTTTLSAYLMGYVSTENGMLFNNNDRDITKYTAHFQHNSAGYGGFGLETNARLDANAPDIAAKVKEIYPQPSDYTGYDTDFVPYAAVIQATQMVYSDYPYFGKSMTFVQNHDSEIEAVFDAYGVNANRDKLKTYIGMIGASTYYHGGGMNMHHVSTWTALWASTSPNDNERSFDRIKILHNTYDESSARPYILGKGGKDNSTAKWGQSVSGEYFSINGTPLTVTLWTYVRENCGNKAYFDSNSKVWFDKWAEGAGGHVILNGHYGVMAYLMGQKILEDLGVSAPLATGGYVDECACYDTGTGVGGSGTIGSVDISNIQAGTPQGPWSEATLAILNANTTLKPYYGRLTSIENPDKQLSGLGKTVEEWRQSTKFGIPYFFQNDNALGTAEGNIPSSWTTSLPTLGNAGCHIYMYSYMASCLTGKVINPTEMTVVLHHKNGISGSGLNQSGNVVPIFNELGLKAVNWHSGAASGDLSEMAAYIGVSESDFKSNSSDKIQKVVDALLDKNGVVGFAGAKGGFTKNKNHYVVLYEKTSEGYRVTGYNGGGIYPVDTWPYKYDKTTSGDVYTWDYIYKSMTQHTNARSYDNQRFFAYNPNFVSGGSGGNGGNGGSVVQTIGELKNLHFIGDSFTHMLNQNVGLDTKGYKVSAAVGATPTQFIGSTSGDKTVGMQGAEQVVNLSNSTDTDAFVVLLGVNGVTNSDQVDKMKEFLNELRTKYSDKPIFVQKVFPVGSNHWSGNAAGVQSSINTFNDEIKSFCDSTDGFYFIDTTEGLVGSDGYLLNADGEGIHISDTASYTKWFENIDKAIKDKSPQQEGGTYVVDCVPAGGSGEITGPTGDMTSAKDTKEERWQKTMGSEFSKYSASWTGMTARNNDANWRSYRDSIVTRGDIVKITVQAWDKPGDAWESYEFDILVNKNLAPSLQAVFKDLYNLPENERTPIHNRVTPNYTALSGISHNFNSDCFAYGPRGDGSIHCIGAAIDINIAENPMPGQCGTWADYQPGINPYSIAPSDKIVEIFGRYGFEWGDGYNDFMHFSYLESVSNNISTWGQ